MQILARLIVSGLAVFVTAYILPGITVDSFITAIIVAVVLGVVNAVLKPILIIFTLPITIVTLGLFTFVINAVLVLLVAALISGFAVSSFLWALVFSLMLSIVSTFLNSLTK